MLETVQPREQSGRDALGGFRAQARSAALASLSILEGKEVDRVYCDMHDDFVVRINRGGQLFYVFYQVKTNKKQNHNWTLNEVFGLNSRKNNTRTPITKLKIRVRVKLRHSFLAIKFYSDPNFHRELTAKR
ncbi:MAG: dsDNA nuclease domain-containing protein [Sedimenticola sp.]